MTNHFVYSDWADDTLEVHPSTTRAAKTPIPALLFIAPSGPEIPAAGVRDLRDYLNQWLAANDTQNEDAARD